jgi:hypothetical protein
MCSFSVCTRANTLPQKLHLVWPLCVLQWCFRDPRLRNDLPQVSQQNSAAGWDLRSSDHRVFCNIHNGSKGKTDSKWIIMANICYIKIIHQCHEVSLCNQLCLYAVNMTFQTVRYSDTNAQYTNTCEQHNQVFLDQKLANGESCEQSLLVIHPSTGPSSMFTQFVSVNCNVPQFKTWCI